MEEKKEETKATTTSISINVPKDKGAWIGLGIAALTFIMLFFNWWKYKFSYDYGYGIKGSTDKAFSMWESDMFDASTWLGLGKVCVIIALIVFIVYIVATFIDFKAFVPALEKIDLNKLLGKAYYVIYILALVFCLIGTFTFEGAGTFEGAKSSCYPVFGWYLSLVVTAIGTIWTFKPSIIKDLIGRVNIKK